MTNYFHKYKEYVIYLLIWTIMFLAPIISMYLEVRSGKEVDFNWRPVLGIWKIYIFYLLAFITHNFFLAPFLVYKKQAGRYFLLSSLLVVVFFFVQYYTRPKPPHHRPRTPIEVYYIRTNSSAAGSLSKANDTTATLDTIKVEDELWKSQHHRHFGPSPMIEMFDFLGSVMLIMLLGLNLGVKFYIKQEKEEKIHSELEQRHLQEQLAYLRYQINPHFFMNTLNNIHALVDISPAEAQEAIITLSRLLRYVLYESNKDRVPMQQEVAFMENYVRLMKIRYTDNLSFSVTQLADYSGILVPPLLFISFVENAFKHGVSYVEKSFIEITNEHYHTTKKQDRLRWTCRNSKHSKSSDEATKTPTTPDTRQGVGMKNVRQRLNLLYGKDYTLDVRETDDTFEVMLDIPLET